MPIANITNVNPYAVDRSAEIAGQASIGRGIAQGLQTIGQSIASGQQRRKEADEENKAIAEAEIKFNETTFGDIERASTGDRLIDAQIQQIGVDDKKAFYKAKKEWDTSDHGDDARKAYEESRQKTLGRAKEIRGALEKLGPQIQSFKDNYGNLSNANDPNLRAFMLDMQDGSLDPEQYSLIEDKKTGKLKYVGKTSLTDAPVEFYLDDIANGTNQFAPLEKVDLEDLTQKFSTNAAKITKQIENEYGIATKPDFNEIRKQIGSEIDNHLKNEASLKTIGAELGYDYDKFEEANATAEGREAMVADIKSQLLEESVANIPDQAKQVSGPLGYAKYNATLADRKAAAKEEALVQAAAVKQQKSLEFSSGLESGDLKFLNQYKGHKTSGGVIQQVSRSKSDPNKINIAYQGHSKNKPKGISFNISDPHDKIAFANLLGLDGSAIGLVNDNLY